MSLKSPYIKDITGKKFGRLLVQSLAFVKKGHAHWNVICDCGQVVVKNAGKLEYKPDVIKSCSRQCSLHKVAMSEQSRTHGHSRHPLYHVWRGIKRRCLNPKDASYNSYGGRGIKVCEHWMLSFANFWDDMNAGWERGLQIDRINNDGDYTPENCQWVTPRVNAYNKRNTVIGIEIVDKALENGVAYSTLYQRIKNSNMGAAIAATIPSGCTPRIVNVPEELVSIAAANGIKYGTLYARIGRYGMEPMSAATTPPPQRKSHSPISNEIKALALSNGISRAALAHRVQVMEMSPQKAATIPLLRLRQA